MHPGPEFRPDGGDDLQLTYIWFDSGAWYHGGAVGPSGDGANVSLVTEDGDIIVDEWVWVQTLARVGSNSAGDGGDIIITATNGGFSVSDFGINTQSQVASGSSGNAGAGGDVIIVELTDTLPGEVSFDHWIQQPAGAAVAAGELAWTGTVPANGQVTFSFVVTHTGEYGEVVTNTASFFHPDTGSQGSDEAAFTVEPDPTATPTGIYLPVVLR